MKIVLIGFMGTGKSIVAPILARKLSLDTIEMDDLIVKKAGGKSIVEIFDTGGEKAFRELESAVSMDLRGRDNAVISTGGGVVTSKANMECLADAAVIVELDAAFDTILRRIGSGPPRPLFTDSGQARALYELRKPLYSHYGDLHIATDGKSIDEIVQAIIGKTKEVKSP